MSATAATGHSAGRQTGDAASFDRSWSTRQETHYLHWTRGEPQNQIQLAFRQHWSLFQQILGPAFAGRRVLEVGCGRGSMSAYFADAGFECTLLDLSQTVIDTAQRIFAHHGLAGQFDVGDALDLPYADRSFDVVVSIGLLEHFKQIDQVISEQVRVLDSGGAFLGYVVPHQPDNVQKDYRWINRLLTALVPSDARASAAAKPEIYRSDALSPPYLEVMQRLPLRDIGSSGVYPLPMVSHSVDFPFTLLEPQAEAVLVEHFNQLLNARGRQTGQHPWLCDENYGQAFLLWGFKTT